MGQQQLLLIVIGVVIVGIMIAVGMTLFSDQATSSNRDALGNDLLNIAARAHEYYRKPQTIGGGGRSFVGLSNDAAGIRRLISTTVNPNGSYAIITAGTSSMVEIEGVGHEEFDGSLVRVRVRVFPNSDSVYTVN
jgi:Tfp pilus assembly protein PilE